VHALGHRLRVLQSGNPETKTWAEKKVAELSKGGLLLTQPFYQLLLEYEQSGQPFDLFLPNLLERLPECDR